MPFLPLIWQVKWQVECRLISTSSPFSSILKILFVFNSIQEVLKEFLCSLSYLPLQCLVKLLHLGSRILHSMVPTSSCDKFCDLMAITITHECIIFASSVSSLIVQKHSSTHQESKVYSKFPTLCAIPRRTLHE